MSKPRACVLRASGTNCDLETVAAWELSGAAAQRVHVGLLRERPALLSEFDLLTIPGGFSYGDDCGAGRIFAIQLRRYLQDAVRGLLERGGLVLGICNGFQALVAAGFLPGGGQRATLAPNASGRFECRWVELEAGPAATPFLEPGARLRLPVAHGEGRVLAAEIHQLAERIAIRYINPPGESRGDERKPSPATYPANPNGSMMDAAGLTDASGQVLGLMPHPERAVRPWQCAGGEPGGLAMFQRAVRALGG